MFAPTFRTRPANRLTRRQTRTTPSIGSSKTFRITTGASASTAFRIRASTLRWRGSTIIRRSKRSRRRPQFLTGFMAMTCITTARCFSRRTTLFLRASVSRARHRLRSALILNRSDRHRRTVTTCTWRWEACVMPATFTRSSSARASSFGMR